MNLTLLLFHVVNFTTQQRTNQYQTTRWNIRSSIIPKAPSTTSCALGWTNELHYDKHRRQRPYNRRSTLCFVSNRDNIHGNNIGNDLFALIRPFTLLQAVGALLVGCFAVLASTTSSTPVLTNTDHVTQRIILACLSVYLSYGTGMVMNDCMDHAIDAMHESKRNRPLASGRITVRKAWIFSILLALISLIVAGMCSTSYAIWTLSNLSIMWLYALGLQKILLVKNIVVGWLGISPLLGAQLLLQPFNHNYGSLSSMIINPALVPLSIAGFGVGMAREILKDLEDVDVDRVAGKRTLPHVIGPKQAHRLAFSMAYACCATCWSRQFRVHLFQSNPIYTVSLLVGTVMVARASRLTLSKGQSLLKQTIYVLLAGMIGSFWIRP